MKVAVIGCGFVGSALIQGLNEEVEIYKVDPKFGTSISDLDIFDPDIIFICVPTPMSSNRSQNLEVLKNVCDEILENKLKSLIVLKSTVLPDEILKISNDFDNFIYNPEFLTERNAEEDFINSELIIFGGEKKNQIAIESFYRKYTKCISDNYIYTDLISASLAKYTINSFLATKVIFFNELYKLFHKTETSNSWESFIELLSNDSRIGSSHMMVPGNDNRYGFGGACFPKDTQALLNFSQNFNCELNLLKKVININNNIRSEYNDLTQRESEQNVKFFNGENS